jgi:hypothetical protein
MDKFFDKMIRPSIDAYPTIPINLFRDQPCKTFFLCNLQMGQIS